MLASSSLLDGRVESKLIPSKFDLQTSYALDVFIDKSIAILLDYSRAVVNNNYTGNRRAY